MTWLRWSSFRLERSLEAISVTDNLRETVFRLVQVGGARAGLARSSPPPSNPDRTMPRCSRFAERFGLAAKAPNSSHWRGQTDSFDIAVWRARLGAVEARVCRVQVDIGGTMQYGTGFLVGPDLVLTAYHVVSSAIEARSGPRGISLLFDFKSLANGETINPGTVCLIRERDWLVDASPFGAIAGEDALDYALLKVEGSPGSEPIGGDRAEPGAAPRGWITVPRRPFDLVPGSPAVYPSSFPRRAPPGSHQHGGRDWHGPYRDAAALQERSGTGLVRGTLFRRQLGTDRDAPSQSGGHRAGPADIRDRAESSIAGRR